MITFIETATVWIAAACIAGCTISLAVLDRRIRRMKTSQDRQSDLLTEVVDAFATLAAETPDPLDAEWERIAP